MQMHRAGERRGARAFGELVKRFGEAADRAGDLGFAHFDHVVQHFAQDLHGVGGRHARRETVRDGFADGEFAASRRCATRARERERRRTARR